MIFVQSAGEPEQLQQLEAQRQALLDKGDAETATRHEMQMLATLLNSQFGQAHVDHQQDLVLLQVIFAVLICSRTGHGFAMQVVFAI